MTQPFALVATLHDPDAASLPFLARPEVTKALGWYPAVTIAATVATDPRVVARLQALGAQVVEGGPTGVARRAALEAAPSQLGSSNIDFDRWLHWLIAWPDELEQLPTRIERVCQRQPVAPWCVLLGRTARAFNTHPPVQRIPETATNRTLSLAVGTSLDAVAGAVWLAPEGREMVLGSSIEESAATDLEWAALILRQDPARLRGLRFEGLEWETPDFHAAAITEAGGREAWVRAVFDTPEMWTVRLQLAAASVTALQRVLRA
ncbi:MAG: hypothetical protein KC442_07655 [Thermomicrobiales bacterium]|nr:hypothetical protein [Thermomicrobiales bacterium]